MTPDPILAALDAADEALADQLDDDRYGPADARSTTLCGWETCDSPPTFAVDGRPSCANHLHLVTAVALYNGAERPVSVRCWP